MKGYEFTRLTFFHVLWLASVFAGMVFGGTYGHQYLGIWGGVVGGISGFIIGHILATIPARWAERSLFTDIENSSVDELWAIVAKPDWNFHQTLALLKLASLEQDVTREVPRIVEMLESDSELTRRYGYDALRIVFDREYHLIPAYTPRDDALKCRTNLANLKAALKNADGCLEANDMTEWARECQRRFVFLAVNSGVNIETPDMQASSGDQPNQ